MFQYILGWHIVVALISLYTLYYFIEVVQMPYLAAKEGPFKSFLLKNVPTISTKFWPTFWCVESRAQTVVGSILRTRSLPIIKYRQEIIVLNDGGEVALDWMEDGCTQDSPLIVFLPGITGQSQADYLKSLVTTSAKVGIRSVVVNNRGFGVPLKTPRLYCAANCEDFREVMQHIWATNPNVKIGASGISMGGIILGNYLARHSEEATKFLSAAIIISALWNVPEGMKNLHRPIFNQLLQRKIAFELCKILQRPSHEILMETNLPMQQIIQSKSLREFDTMFTSKLFGFKNVEEMYAEASLHYKIDLIKVPVLCLNAADDPFQPFHLIPIKEIEQSSHIAMLVTARGGHTAFLEGWNPTSTDQFFSRLSNQFFTAALFDSNNEFQNVLEGIKS